MVLPLYYCNIRNFGDKFNIPFFRHLGFDPDWCPADRALVSGCGSILGHVAGNKSIVIFGSGMHAPFNHAMIYGQIPLLRGPLTRGCIYGPFGASYGDPGLMASRLWPVEKILSEGRKGVGIIPHLDDRRSKHFQRLSKGCRLIDPMDDPDRVAAQVAACDCIISSSLHGLIFAHSYGIPAVWVRDSRKEIGGGFKFRDYFRSVGITTRKPVDLSYSSELENLLAKAQVPCDEVVLKMQNQILKAAARLPDTIEMASRMPRTYSFGRKVVRRLGDFGIRIAGSVED